MKPEILNSGNPRDLTKHAGFKDETQPTRDQQGEQTGHTPGPWKHGTPGKGRFCVYQDGGHGRGICVLSNTQKQSAYEVEKYGEHPLNLEADANARLIAAAPELLAALQLALVQWPAAHREQPRIIAQIEDAIAKAEGRAQ